MERFRRADATFVRIDDAGDEQIRDTRLTFSRTDADGLTALHWRERALELLEGAVVNPDRWYLSYISLMDGRANEADR